MAKALDMSERFFEQIALPSLEETFPESWERMASGLVGYGSECLGFDDELSQERGWGIEFYIWMTDADFSAIGDDVRRWKLDLMADHPELRFRDANASGVEHTVLSSSVFYSSLIGFPRAPETVLEWRRVPEANLSLCTNGRVFADPLGEFTSVRESIAGYYPEDLRLKKIAVRCFSMAQSGQYDFLRSSQREDVVGKEMALGEFVRDCISMVFLLNKRYMPCRKWAYRAMLELPRVAGVVAPLLEALYDGDAQAGGQLDPGTVLVKPVGVDDERRAAIVEEICSVVIGELHEQGLSDSDSTYLLQHGEEVHSKIEDPDLQRLPMWVE